MQSVLKRHTAIAATVIAVISSASNVVHAASLFRIIELPVPPSATTVVPRDISNRGEVVGTVIDATASTGFSYYDGTMILMDAPIDHLFSQAAAVNDLGMIVGWTTDQGIPKSAIWSSAVDPAPEVLESSGGSGANVFATGINNAGLVSGYFTGSGSGNTSSWRAVRWVPDAQGRLRQDVLVTGVIPLPPGVFHAAYGINSAGQVVGTGAWVDSDLITSQAAIRWAPNGQPEELTVLLGFNFAPRFAAQAINDAAVAVGNATANNGVHRAVRWGANAAVTDLGVLPGYAGSTAADINNAGQIVGTHSAGSTTVAAVYENGVWSDLNPFIYAAPGWNLTSATGINDVGWIIGEGILNGAPRAALLIPLDDPGSSADCLGGPHVQPSPLMIHTTASCLQTFDFDADGDVDLVDYAVLLVALSTP